MIDKTIHIYRCLCGSSHFAQISTSLLSPGFNSLREVELSPQQLLTQLLPNLQCHLTPSVTETHPPYIPLYRNRKQLTLHDVVSYNIAILLHVYVYIYTPYNSLEAWLPSKESPPCAHSSSASVRRSSIGTKARKPSCSKAANPNHQRHF